MWKQIVVGVVLVLVVVGLSGCNETASNNDIVSFQELNNHFAKYIEKNITMDGYVGEVIRDPAIVKTYSAFFYDSPTTWQYLIVLEIPKNIVVYRGMYKITGIVGESFLPAIATIKVTKAEVL